MSLRIVGIALILATSAFGSRPETFAEALKRHHIALTKSGLVSALQSSDPEVRWLAAAQLAEEKAKDAVPAMEKALAIEAVPRARVNIAFALAQFGDENGVKTVVSACHDSSLNELRMTAARHMVDLKSNACLPDVLALLGTYNDGDAPYRSEAVELAPSFKDLSADESERLFSAVVHALQDTSPSVRIYASDALVRFRDERAIPYLQEAIDAERDDSVRTNLKNALQRLQNLNKY